MQSTQYRCLVLIAVLLAGWGLLTATQQAQAAEARWPTDNAVFALPDWAVSPPNVEHPYFATHFVTRRYVRDGVVATVTVKTDPEAKNIYRTGAEVAYLGGGYTVEPAPAELVPPAPGRQALIASRDRERWLVVYSFGEHRGLLGNGPLAWSLAALDGILGHPNDYYYLTVSVRLDDPDATKAAAAVTLADTLFPRIAAWYAD